MRDDIGKYRTWQNQERFLYIFAIIYIMYSVPYNVLGSFIDLWVRYIIKWKVGLKNKLMETPKKSLTRELICFFEKYSVWLIMYKREFT